MSGKYLLDTNIVIALFANDSAIVGKIGESENIFIPAVVIGELFYGAKKSAGPERNSERIERFASDNVILSCNEQVAEIYGKIKNGLRKKGRPIPRAVQFSLGAPVSRPA
uniref:tRNA(fMet)-specific endonuclease VapC n=1 Tax=Candidatus Kentrum sp. FM TaxID=2126340 RepID=A0A450S6U9_9GAMM|nr:MAG: tRNA(fMet)-specific endonuclease VapC [Candidatus Kentron sp. FM]VFK07581.1 MAG: tRNA(fMet)-specific endonuclease VapC [Candidatus Kentron sp. FM]